MLKGREDTTTTVVSQRTHWSAVVWVKGEAKCFGISRFSFRRIRILPKWDKFQGKQIRS